MVEHKPWSGSIARLSALAGSLSVGILVFGATGTEFLASAQPAASQAIGTPASEIGRQIKPHAHVVTNAAVSRSLSQIQEFQAAHPDVGLKHPAHRPLIPMGEAAYREAKRRAALLVGAKPMSPGANVPPPAAPTNIVLTAAGPKGSDPGNGDYPPDSTGAIGGSQIVVPVNLTYNVYSRSGGLLLNTTFNALLGTSNGLSDPRVIYDPIWKRWVVTIIDVPASASAPPACFWVAASQNANARGPFWIYHLCPGGGSFANGDLWDYDMQGMTQDAVLVTGNIFACCFTSDKGEAIAALPKAKIYNGLAFSIPVPLLPASVGTLTPPIVQDSNANAFFLGADSDHVHLDLYKGTNLSNEGQFSLSLQAQISSTSFSVPPSARQPGTTEVLDTLDGRFQAASAQYGNSLWNVHTTGLGAFPAPYFYQLDTSANTIVQSGYFYESLTSDDFNPSIAANTAGEAIVTWSSTDATASTGKHNARIRFSGWQPGDTAGLIGAGTAFAGSASALTGNKQGSVQRWGDYSSVFLDSNSVSACGGANRRAAIFNEKIFDANTWQVAFGIVGFC